MRRQANTRTGRLLAKTLAGSWRSSSFPPLDISGAEVDELTPLLCASGAAALAWRRIRETELRGSASAEVLNHAARFQSLQAALHEQKVEKVFRLLGEASVDAILAKGWAAASLYSSRDLRPSGDIDICVRPTDFKRAAQIVTSPEGNNCRVDLHQGFEEFPERTVDELFSRSSVTLLGQVDIQTLSSEDHLALLCIHFLKHGGWRPLWLCDIAAAIETLPAEFDWDVCLGRNETRSRWIKCAINLATDLLGAKSDGLPLHVKVKLPRWLVESVLQQWATPFALKQAPMNHPVPMRNLLRHPADLLDGLGQRWPNPILATVSVDGSFNEFPRFPYQVANLMSRAGRFVFNGFKTPQDS